MTDVLAALAMLADLDRPERPAALAGLRGWSHDELVIDKWFWAAGALVTPGHPRRVQTWRATLPRAQEPNRVRALVGAFAQGDQCAFTMRAGAGYVFLADEVITLDPVNPTLAARLIQPLGMWRRHDPARQPLMRISSTDPRHPRSQQEHLRDGVEEPGLASRRGCAPPIGR